jgi:hypothetical protein
MEQPTNFRQSRSAEQVFESVALQHAQPGGGQHYAWFVLLQNRKQDIDCRLVPQSLIQVRRACIEVLKDVVSTVGLVQAENVVEIQEQNPWTEIIRARATRLA